MVRYMDTCALTKLCLCVTVVSMDPIYSEKPQSPGFLPAVVMIPLFAWLPDGAHHSGVLDRASCLARQRQALYSQPLFDYEAAKNPLGMDAVCFPQGTFADALCPDLLEYDSRLHLMQAENAALPPRSRTAGQGAADVQNCLYCVDFEYHGAQRSTELLPQLRDLVLSADGPGYCRVNASRLDTEVLRPPSRNKKAPPKVADILQGAQAMCEALRTKATTSLSSSSMSIIPDQEEWRPESPRVFTSCHRRYLTPADVHCLDQNFHFDIVAVQEAARHAVFGQTNFDFHPEADNACAAASHYTILLDNIPPPPADDDDGHGAALAANVRGGRKSTKNGNSKEAAQDPLPPRTGSRHAAREESPCPVGAGSAARPHVGGASASTTGGGGAASGARGHRSKPGAPAQETARRQRPARAARDDSALQPGDGPAEGRRVLRSGPREAQRSPKETDGGRTRAGEAKSKVPRAVGECTPRSQRTCTAGSGIPRWPADMCGDDDVLNLVVETDPFVVMFLGEKRFEYRQCTSYWRQRLFTPKDEWRGYKYLHICLGMQPDRPQFLAECLGVTKVQPQPDISYSTGYVLALDHPDGYWALRLGATVWCSGAMHLGMLRWSGAHRQARRGKGGLPGFGPAPP